MLTFLMITMETMMMMIPEPTPTTIQTEMSVDAVAGEAPFLRRT